MAAIYPTLGVEFLTAFLYNLDSFFNQYNYLAGQADVFVQTGPFILRSGCRIFLKNAPDAVFLEQMSLSAKIKRVTL